MSCPKKNSYPADSNVGRFFYSKAFHFSTWKTRNAVKYADYQRSQKYRLTFLVINPVISLHFMPSKKIVYPAGSTVCRVFCCKVFHFFTWNTRNTMKHADYQRS